MERHWKLKNRNRCSQMFNTWDKSTGRDWLCSLPKLTFNIGNFPILNSSIEWTLSKLKWLIGLISNIQINKCQKTDKEFNKFHIGFNQLIRSNDLRWWFTPKRNGVSLEQCSNQICIHSRSFCQCTMNEKP